MKTKTWIALLAGSRTISGFFLRFPHKFAILFPNPSVDSSKDSARGIPMKTKTWIALLAGVFALCLGLSLLLLWPREPASQVRILSGGKTVQTVSLSQDQTILVPAPNGGSNTVTIQGGMVAVTTATCPDQYCVRRGFCNSGQTVSLSQDHTILGPAPNGGSNAVTIQGGMVAVTTATCPDQYCVRRGFCNSGAQIVCLPNQLVLQFLGETQLDGVSG